MEIYSSIEYETIILTITKPFENGNSFDANICTVIHTVEGYVIFAETTGLVSFHDLNWVIAYCFEENEKYIYIFRLMEVRSGVENWSIILPDLLTFGAILSMRLWWFVAIVNMIYLQWLFVKALNCHQPLSFNANEMNKKVWKCH